VLVIVLFAARVGGRTASALGQPAVLGELLAGVILGPTVIDLFGEPFGRTLVSDEHLEETVLLLAEIGVVFLMFLAGLETELHEVNKVRHVAILAGTFGVAFPIALGAVGALPFGFDAKDSVFIGIVLAATSVSISARTLMQLGALQERQGVSILAAAVIDDVLVILVLSFFTAFAVDAGGAGEVAGIVLRVALFFAVAFIVGVVILPPVARLAMNTLSSEGILVGAVTFILLAAWFSEYIGQVAMITGAFLAGVFMRRTEMHEAIEERMHALSYGFFVPIFFVGVGLSADAGGLEGSDFALVAVISVIAVVSKIAGCGLGAYLAGEGIVSSLQIGTGMVSRGEVGLIVASVGLANGLIDTDGFSVMVLMVLITTILTPVLLRIAFRTSRGVA
jgi:Kef-type K+ transport system membrane component KefB